MGQGERDTVARGARLCEAAQAAVADHDRAVEEEQARLGMGDGSFTALHADGGSRPEADVTKR